jgi:hypothetical protein
MMDIFVRAAGLSDKSTSEEILNLAADAMDAAADEIERLRKENIVLSSTLSKLLGKMAADEMAENLLNHGTLTGEE